MNQNRSTALLTLVLAGLAVLATVACSGPSSAPPTPVDIPLYPAQAFHETVSLSGSSFSADESRLLVTSDESGIFNVFSQPLRGGERERLTSSTVESFRGLSWFPDDDRFLYSADEGGNELHHVYVHELDGSATDLTPGQGLRASFAGWSGDRKSFYVASNERDPRAIDLYRYATDGYQRQLIWENDGQYFPGGVSRDGRWLSLARLVSNADSDVFVVDLERGETRHVTPHDGMVEHSPGIFTPDSTKLYYTTAGAGGFREVWSYDLQNGSRTPVLQADWDVFFVSYSEGGRYRIAAINEDASTKVTILDTSTSTELEIPGLPAGDIAGVGFSRSETKVAFYLTSDRSPANLWVYDLEAGGAARQLTSSLNPAIDEDHLVGSEVVRYPSFDGLEIPAILWRPHNTDADRKVAALVWVHGGPGGQSRRTYTANIQHLVNHGYAVLAVNNRGSSGYGRDFYHLDDQQHGDVDLDDVVWARNYLESLDWVDGSRIGIIGGSYGGYMVAAALAFEPEVFDVGIDIFGVTNWLRTLESMPAWWGAQRDALYAEMGNPETDRERLERISPLFHADQIVRPLLVVQGAKDPRVLQVESDELVEKVRANGVPVEYVLFDDEGHGFSKRHNRISASEAFVTFLDKHLGRPPS